MIELVSASKCIGCNQCVRVCPTNVFDEGDDGLPVIARQSDCQTCFMCELYCPVDALYVEPDSDGTTDVTEQEAERQGWIGSYREQVGWGRGRTPITKNPLMLVSRHG